MSNRKHNDRIYHLERGKRSNPVVLFAKITAAADVAASGYTVTHGGSGKGVSSVTRTGEGIMRITLSDPYTKVLSISVLASSSAVFPTFTAEDVDGATPYVDVTFYETDGTPVALDPDGATIFATIYLEN